MTLPLIKCDDRFETGDGFELDSRFGAETSTEDFICWSLRRFTGWRTTFTTSFGMEGCALIDMYASRSKPMEVVYLDTGFFFDETYALIERMKERYPQIEFINAGTTLSPLEQAETYGEKLWETNPDLCCRLRKVDPLAAVMASSDIWINSIRRSQSPSRAKMDLIEWDERFEVLKLNPLAYWERDEVWTYVQEHDVPYNELHERGFPSIGCTHCTLAVKGAGPSEYTRLGRWSGIEKTECGLHLVKS
jgi:phosphoadenosine phosphosulfate reductase